MTDTLAPAVTHGYYFKGRPARYLGVSDAMRQLIAEQAPLILTEVLSQIAALGVGDAFGTVEGLEPAIQVMFSDEVAATGDIENMHDNARILLEDAVLRLAHDAGFDWVTL